MKAFLEELAEKIYRQHLRPEEVVVVFPNRRAILYFRKYLSALLDKPSFSPALLTIEDFIGSFSNLKVPDKIELVFQLHKVYHKIMSRLSRQEADTGTIEEFYFWGEMLLRDFEEIDKYMVDAAQLFKDLSHQKELDSSFDFLTGEQRKFLRSFWGNFDEHQSVNKKKFLYIWRQLPEVYADYKKHLRRQGLAYEGMIHREVAEQLAQGAVLRAPGNNTKLKFAGFNALTQAEEKIISFFVEQGAEVYWDLDAYYVNNDVQEAGKFFREYQQHHVLQKTFSQDIPAHDLLRKGFNENGKPCIRILGAPQPIGQAKLMSQLLKEELAKGILPEETLIVLPDEKLLLPVLHGISGSVEKLNVTMGFPLASAPLFNFTELLIDLQVSRKKDHFNYRQVLALLGHPYVVAADAAHANAKRKEILKHNWVHIPESFLGTEVPLHRLIFRAVDYLPGESPVYSLIQYMKAIVTEIGSLPTTAALDKEYAFHYMKFFNRLQEVLVDEAGKETVADSPGNSKRRESDHLKSFLRLFRQLIRSYKIPFSGEPLRGLQVMGVLETRNLDFKNVFILSLNEGAFPAAVAKGSYIPYSIRKAYQLPTPDHQDAIYAYLFYRVLQRAENVFIFYNSETDVLGQGEMSRYLQQLLYESNLPVERKIVHNPVQPQNIQPIEVMKNPAMMESLARLNEGTQYSRGFSPSALNSYIECRLKFYFRYVARIKEADAVDEELDARVLGNFLHHVMERFYKRIGTKKNSRNITAEDFENYETIMEGLIDEVFIEAYRLPPDKKVEYEGQRLVVKEIVKRFAHRIVEMDKVYAPFSMEAIEQEGLTYNIAIDKDPGKVLIGGKIDRIDRKENILRIIDYKTGKDQLNFESVASLFERNARRNKAAFQTLLYAMLYKENFRSAAAAGIRLVPGLINRMNLFDDGFTFGLRLGRTAVEDVEVLLPEFEMRLKELFEELYDPARSFDQTSDAESCRNCAYAQICYR